MLYASFWHLFIMTSAVLRSNPTLQVEMQLFFFLHWDASVFCCEHSVWMQLKHHFKWRIGSCFVCLFSCLLSVREVLIVTEVECRKLSICFGIPSRDFCNPSLIKKKIKIIFTPQYEIMIFVYLFDALSKWTFRHDYLSSLNMQMGPLNLNLKIKLKADWTNLQQVRFLHYQFSQLVIV